LGKRRLNDTATRGEGRVAREGRHSKDPGWQRNPPCVRRETGTNGEKPERSKKWLSPWGGKARKIWSQKRGRGALKVTAREDEAEENRPSLGH